MNPGVFELFTQYIIFDGILAQFTTGYDIIPGGKKLGGFPHAGNKCFTHAPFGFPFLYPHQFLIIVCRRKSHNPMFIDMPVNLIPGKFCKISHKAPLQPLTVIVA
jgi:hypothetical protein